MPSSGITAWPMTAGDIVAAALDELGVYGGGDEIDVNDLDRAILRLNAMLKTWAGALNMFREETGTLTIVGGTGAATLDADIRNISSVRHVVNSTYQRPLSQWNRDEYYMMPNRATAGSPTAYYVSRAIGGDVLYIWPVPAANVTLHLDYASAAETVTDQAQTLDVPEEWQEAIILGLASRCASMFGTTRIDPGTVGRIDERARELYGVLLDRDRPDSYYFEPEPFYYG